MSFSLQACAVPAGIGETVVVDWLEDELAVGGLIAAYGLYDAVPPLLRSFPCLNDTSIWRRSDWPRRAGSTT